MLADAAGKHQQIDSAQQRRIAADGLAHGARIAGRLVGTFGDAAAFSFYPTKNLGALGDAGAILPYPGASLNRKPLHFPRRYGVMASGLCRLRMARIWTL